MNLEELIGKDVMDMVANGDAEITIRGVGADAACDGCAEDSCPVEEVKEETPTDEEIGSVMDMLMSMLFPDDVVDKMVEEPSDELLDAEKQAVESYHKSVEELGKERADAMLELSMVESIIQVAMAEKLPMRTKDLERYNALLDIILPDRVSFITDLKYARLDRGMEKGLKRLRKAIEAN